MPAGNAPDEHGLAEIAALLRQPPLRGDVEQAAEAEGRVEDEAAKRDAGGVKAALQDVIAEDARLFQVGVQIAERSRICPGACLTTFAAGSSTA